MAVPAKGVKVKRFKGFLSVNGSSLYGCSERTGGFDLKSD